MEGNRKNKTKEKDDGKREEGEKMEKMSQEMRERQKPNKMNHPPIISLDSPCEILT